MSDPTRTASPRLVLVIVCAGVVLASLDLFIVNVALPQMARDFELRGDGVADLSWVLNAYAIVYASLLVLFGRVAGRYAREGAFLLGVALFVAACQPQRDARENESHRGEAHHARPARHDVGE